MFKSTAATLALLLLAMAAAPSGHAMDPVERYQAGRDYFLIEPAQPTAVADKVEVLEVFSYACHVCASFQPEVDKWLKSKPADAAFGYLPVAWNPAWESLARAYYAADALGVQAQTHAPMFNAVHIENIAFAKAEDIAQWYAQHGAQADTFLATMNSFAVNAKIARSKTLVPRYGVDGTPAVVVAGKYRITGKSAQGYEHVFDVVNFLVAKETAARKSKT